MKKLLERYKRFVFGDEQTFDVQKKVFLLITHISFIIGIIGVIVDVLLDLGVFLTLVTFLTVLLVLFFHIKVRNSNLELKYSISFASLSIIILPILWIFNGGYNGNSTILIFVYFTVILTILPAKIRIYSLLAFLIMISTLTIIQYSYPNVIIAYVDEQSRFVDLFLGSILYLILSYSIQNTILKNYELDRKKIKLQNSELSLVVEKLNDANHKLENSLSKIEEMNSAKDRFITILSHDLRSPFQGLKAISKSLESDYDSLSQDERKFYISQISRSLDKLYYFLDQLLVWGKLQGSGNKIKLKECYLDEIIISSISVLSDVIEIKKIIIETDVEKNLRIYADKEMLSTVLRNIISNAIKFSYIGGRVKVSAIKNDSEIKISITDAGIGIAKKLINKLFILDEILSTAGTNGEMGSGMGLILCNDIIKKHNGSISVESEEGKGSTFIIQLPA